MCDTDQNNNDGDALGNICDESQQDLNADGVGDVCDADDDGVQDGMDNCPVDVNANQADSDGIGDACDSPAFYMLKLKHNGQCFDADGTFDVQTTTCNLANTNQRWVMTALGGGKYMYRNVSSDRCMRGYTDIWSVPYVDVQPCNSGDTKQQWELPVSGSDPMYPVQFDNVG